MMTLMSILAASGNGKYFDGVAQACNMSTATAKSTLGRLCPAIAARLKAKAQNDIDSFEALLDLLDEGDDLNGLTDGESIADGKAVLEDLYGSTPAALAEMKRLAPGLDDSQYENISAIAATSVLAVLAKSYATPATLSGGTGEAPQGGGILATIIAAVLKGLLQGARSQFAPKRRRRRSYTSYFGTRRKTTRRKRRAKTPTLEDIFGQILGTGK
ncbi:MAG: DUF937 domain-containing protein [Aestuariivirga sp.]|nr:DUF937 domain-containing protein [Aestuariivirga sp.]